MSNHTFVTKSHGFSADETETVHIVEWKELDGLLRDVKRQITETGEIAKGAIQKVADVNASAIGKLKSNLDAQSVSELEATKKLTEQIRKLDEQVLKLESALSLYEQKWNSIGELFQKTIQDKTWQNVVREVVRPQVEILEQAKSVVVENANYVRTQVESLEALKDGIPTQLNQHVASLDQLLSGKLESMHKESSEFAQRITEADVTEKNIGQQLSGKLQLMQKESFQFAERIAEAGAVEKALDAGVESLKKIKTDLDTKLALQNEILCGSFWKRFRWLFTGRGE